MANITIPNLPATASVDGTEQLEAVQNGTSIRVTAAQIASLAQNTQGTVTQINTAGALTGGPITTTGTISLPPDAVTNVYLAEMPGNTLKANLTGLTANPTDVTPSQLLDTFGNSAGEMLYRDAGVWAALAPGTPGFYLTTTGNQPQWTALSVSPADIQPSGVSPGTYGSASQVPQFTVAASGQITGANNVAITIPSGQVTGLGTMAVQNANNVTITGGTMNGVTIGATSPSQAYFTTISGGVWNGSTIAIAYGGTGATDAATARTNLGLGTMATQNASNVAISGGIMNGVTIGANNPQAGTFTTLQTTGNVSFGTITAGTWNGGTIAVAYGGTGATDAVSARLNLGAAASGANSDITSLSGLTTPLSATQGGTGFASYTTGDLLYATSSSALGRLNDVATGNVLRSGGVGVAPAWGKLDLTTDITNVLTVPNGGTGAANLTGYVYGNGTGAMTASPTIPISALQFNGVTIGSTPITLGSIALTLSGLTSVTLTQDPTLALQAATKQYVDAEVATVSNQTFHTQVVATTTGNLNANYSNGTSGVGATLTNAGTKAQFQTDNVTPDPNARILVKDQTNAFENGIYILSTVGSPDPGGTNWVLTRASDFNTVGAGPNFIQTGAAVFVDQGDTWGSTGWVMNTVGAITVGTTNLDWAQTSAAGSIQVISPLAKSGNIISLNTVPATVGGTGLTSYTVGDLLYANTSTTLAKLADVATGNVLRSGGVGVAPAWGKVALSTDISGTLPVTNGGTGTATAFTSGSVVFAGASGVYSQNNANFFWDNVNTRLGIHTATPDASLTILSETQTALPPGALPAGTDVHIVGANNADARITQDAFGSGNYPAYTGRHARGTAAVPTATQAGDILSQYTGRGFGATAYNSASTGIFQFVAAENFTDTDQGTYASLRLTAPASSAPTEVMRFGPVGQFGVGGSTYGTANQLLTSGGNSAAPSWQSGINITTLDVSGAVNFTTLTDNIAIGTSQTSGTLSLGGPSQTGAVTLAPSTKSITIGIGGGATESAESKTLNIGTAGVSGSTTAINIGASASGSASTTTLYGTVKVNGLTASKPVFTDATSNLTSSGTLLTDQGGTGLTSYAVGDLLYYSTGTALTKLSVGTNGQVLKSTGTVPAWENMSALAVTSLSFGTTGLTPTTLTSGDITVSGTLISSNGGTGLSTYTAGDLLYYAAGTTLSKLGIGTNGQILTSNGSAPVWTSGSSISVNTATNLAGGVAGSVPYQSGASTTTFLSIGAANTVMTSSGTAPQWVTSLTGLTGVSSSSITNTSLTSGRVVYSTTGGAETDSANLTFDGTTLTAANITSGGTWTFSGGTANCVLYLNGSKVASSSANLVFDGTTLTATRGIKAASNGVAVSGFVDGLSVGGYDSIGFAASPATALAIGGYRTSQWSGLEFYTSGTLKAVLDTSGNLGIGTTSPATNLSVVGTGITDASSNGAYQITVDNNAAYNLTPQGGIIHRFKWSSAGTLTTGAGIRFYKPNTNDSDASSQIGFLVRSGIAAQSQAMTLDASGNLGVGTTSPSTFGKLAVQVAGTTTPTNLTNVGPSSINLYAATNGGSTDSTMGIFGWNSTTGLGSGIGFSRENSGDWGTQIRFYTHPTSTTNIGDITERARITSGGYFGVGTSSPSTTYTMTIEGIGADSPNQLYLKRQGSTQGLRISSGGGVATYDSYEGTDVVYGAHVWSATKGSNTVERARITNDGDFLVGTTTSLGKITTTGTGNQTIYFTHSDNSPGRTVTLRLGNNNSTYYAASPYIQAIQGGGIDTYSLAFGTASGVTTASERMRIDSLGNVGIGTASVFDANTRLELSKSGNCQQFISSTDGARMYFSANGSTAGSVAMFSNHPLIFKTNDTERARITNTGGFALGTTTDPGAGNMIVGGLSNTIYGYATTGSRSYIEMYNSSTGDMTLGVTFSTASIKFATGSSNTERARITSGGVVSINTTSGPIWANEKLIVQNSHDGANTVFRSLQGGTNVGQLIFIGRTDALAGYVEWTTTSTSYVTSSDRRLKKNISSADDAGAAIDAIEIVKHDWEDGDHVSYGVIAQDLHKVAPEAVRPGDPDGVEELKKPWGVDYSKLVPMLIKEVQSLRKRVAELEAK